MLVSGGVVFVRVSPVHLFAARRPTNGGSSAATSLVYPLGFSDPRKGRVPQLWAGVPILSTSSGEEPALQRSVCAG